MVTQWNAEELIDAASAIGHGLLRAASEHSDGSITWHRGFGVDFHKVEDAGLFNGRIGEALFFASAGRADPSSGFLEVVPKIVDPLCRRLRSAEEVRRLASEIRFGLTGIGSIVYALVRISDLLREPHYKQVAALAVEHIRSEDLEIDDRYELYWGVSGWLMGCLALLAAGEAIGQIRATEAAGYLLSKRVSDPISKREVWQTDSGQPTGGLAHGNSGIAHALLELHRCSPDERLYEAAIQVFEFERCLFNPELGDWADVHGATAPLMTSWCHGAPGIVMARLSAIQVVRPEDEAKLVADLRAGLSRTSRFPLVGVHTLCCGTMGRADCLLTASLALGNRSLAAAAEPHVRQALAASRAKRLIVGRAGEPHQHGGLWQGAAGVGYQFLRLAAPNHFPSVLRLDRPGVASEAAAR